jgi:GTP cyclohydrolase I
MGCLDDGRFNIELENGMKNCCGENGKDGAVIEDAVKVLLMGLGEDINREGIRKTPLRVAKALREGTRGNKKCFFLFLKYIVSNLALEYVFHSIVVKIDFD